MPATYTLDFQLDPGSYSGIEASQRQGQQVMASQSSHQQQSQAPSQQQQQQLAGLQLPVGVLSASDMDQVQQLAGNTRMLPQ